MIKALFGSIVQVLRKYKRKRYARQFGAIGLHSSVDKRSKLVYENMYLDDYVMIQEHNNFISHKGRLFVKKYSVISAGCIIVPGTHKLKVGLPFWLSAKKHIADETKDIHIGEDCWIGAGCILLPGISIGRGCVIGAGSVVTKDIPDYAVAVGSPARVIGSKFSREDIQIHESIIYQPTERLDAETLDKLFLETYQGMPVFGDNKMSHQDMLSMIEAKSIFGIKDFSNFDPQTKSF